MITIPSIASRLPPAVTFRRVQVVAPTATWTQVLPFSRDRWGYIIQLNQAVTTYWQHYVDGGAGQNADVLNNTSYQEVYRTFCLYGRYVWQPLYGYHSAGVDTVLEVIELILPADCWAKIFDESMAEYRRPS